MKHFRFYPDCSLEIGPVKSVVYDLTNKKTVSFSKDETDILKMWMENKSIEESSEVYGPLAVQLSDKLVKDAYGMVFDGPVYAEAYYPVCKWETHGLFEQPPTLKLAYIQVNPACNANCKFCGDGEFYFWQGCNSCLKWPKAPSFGAVDRRVLEDTLTQLYKLDVEKIVFSGGNPLVNWDTVYELAGYIKKLKPSVSISVNTNGYGFTERVFSDALELDVNFCFTVLADTREGYSEAAGNPGMYDALLNAVETCRSRYIPYSVCLLVVPQLEKRLKELMDFTKSLGGMQLFTAEIFPKHGDGRKILTLPTGEKRIENVDVSEFFSRNRYNTCLAGTVSFSANGVTLPCPMWMLPVGELPESDLNGSFRSGNVEAVWRFTKVKASVCRNCEYKFACSDCSILEWAVQEDSSAQKLFCSYIPELGQWK